MKGQFENKIMSSMVLWFDHVLTKKGEAYTNHESLFYSVEGQWHGYYTYGLPFKQIVSDFSVPSNAPADPQIPTGIYVNGTFVKKGVNNFIDIDYANGHAYFSADQGSNVISGDYAVKDFNIYLTNKLEQELLFETKVHLRPKTSENPTALNTNQLVYPAVFLKNNGGFNEPWALGGEDSTQMNIRAIVLSDSQFNLDAVCSIFKDQNKTNLPIIEEGDYPFNTLGGYKSDLWQFNGDTSVYNYTGLVNGTDDAWIKDVNVSQFNIDYIGEIKSQNPDVFSAIIDFDVEKIRLPRQE